VKKNPIITLTTDFGLRDQYAGAMKGAMLSVNPAALPVDISHSITAGDIFEGAFVMAGACGYYPPGTVHVGVVDPGVGGPRRAVVIETENFFFVGPDNGLMSLAAERDGIRRIVEIKNEEFMRPDVSRTFHGRDIFGPVAAHLSLGVGVCELGPQTTDLDFIRIPEPECGDDEITGEVIHVDTYGNLITNIEGALIEERLGHGEVEVRLKDAVVRGLHVSYASLEPGRVGALTGSSGYVEVAAREASAAALLGAELGDKVRVRRR